MYRFKFAVLFIICLALLSGCTGSNSSFSRKHDKKNDEIKFYNFDWLTSKNDVDAKLKKDFGDGSFIINLQAKYNKINNEIGSYSYIYQGFDGDLKWDIGGHEVKLIILDYVSNDESKTNYLVKARIEYIEHTDEAANDIEEKLSKLYTRTDYNWAPGALGTTYKDLNGNMIELKYLGHDDFFIRDDEYFYIEYSCGDMQEYFKKLGESYDKEMVKEDANGL